MKLFHHSFTDIESIKKIKRQPDFDNLLRVLNRQKPSRHTLFEYFLNGPLTYLLTSHIEYDANDPLAPYKKVIDSYRVAGYDYAPLQGAGFGFEAGSRNRREGTKTISLNEGAVITDWESFEKYGWPDPDSFDYSRLEKLKSYLPDGMKIIVCDRDGIFETVVYLTGYENLCFMLYEEPELVREIFNQVGPRWVRYHEICASFDAVGAHIIGEDLGFNKQTMLPPGVLREYLFPWHKKITETIHRAGKKAILHSCGQVEEIMDDIIDDIKYDAKHSFEDKILPIEQVYDRYSDRIAVLGGLDVDFMARAKPEEVYNRAVAMLERSAEKGGYALGTGNSIPEYIPHENYFAMIAAALFN